MIYLTRYINFGRRSVINYAQYSCMQSLLNSGSLRIELARVGYKLVSVMNGVYGLMGPVLPVCQKIGRFEIKKFQILWNCNMNMYKTTLFVPFYLSLGNLFLN
jgi:hypothetical protein